MELSAKRKKARQPSAQALLPILNGVLASAALTVALVLAAAMLLRFRLLPESAIGAVNHTVKALGSAAAAFIATREPAVRPWLRGAVAGFLYIAAGLVIFSAIAGVFQPSLTMLSDAAMGALIGAASAFLLGRRKE